MNNPRVRHNIAGEESKRNNFGVDSIDGRETQNDLAFEKATTLPSFEREATTIVEAMKKEIFDFWLMEWKFFFLKLLLLLM